MANKVDFNRQVKQAEVEQMLEKVVAEMKEDKLKEEQPIGPKTNQEVFEADFDQGELRFVRSIIENGNGYQPALNQEFGFMPKEDNVVGIYVKNQEIGKLTNQVELNPSIEQIPRAEFRQLFSDVVEGLNEDRVRSEYAVLMDKTATHYTETQRQLMEKQVYKADNRLTRQGFETTIDDEELIVEQDGAPTAKEQVERVTDDDLMAMFADYHAREAASNGVSIDYEVE